MKFLRLTSPRQNVNLWIVPLKMSLAAVALFAVTLTPDLLAAKGVIHIPDWFSMGGIDDARAILSAMLGCVSTVLALIFSVALLVLSMVANLFGPRLLYRFVQDWVTQACIGLFMAAFLYVFLVFLVTHQDANSTFIPQVSLITSWVLVLCAFGFLVFYSHRVAVLIQNPDAIGRIVDDVRRASRRAPAQRGMVCSAAQREALMERVKSSDGAELRSAASGYLQTIAHEALLEAAEAADAQVLLLFRPGQFVLEGEAMAVVAPAAAAARFEPVLQRSVEMGRHRVLAQDVEFGLAQIVEIAIRALSPAINDTFTGIACVDLLGETLTVLAASPARRESWMGRDGVLRLQCRGVELPRLIKQAFDQIRQAAADNPAVLIRLLSTLGRLGPRLHGEANRKALTEQAQAVWETANSRPLVAMDRDDIEAAWRRAASALA